MKLGVASVVSWSLRLACSLERLLSPHMVPSFEQFLTRVLSQNVFVYFAESKDVEEIPGGRTHPGKRTVFSNYPEQPSCSSVHNQCPLPILPPKGLARPGADGGLPRGIHGRQVNSTLQHGLESQGQGEGNLS